MKNELQKLDASVGSTTEILAQERLAQYNNCIEELHKANQALEDKNNKLEELTKVYTEADLNFKSTYEREPERFLNSSYMDIEATGILKGQANIIQYIKGLHRTFNALARQNDDMKAKVNAYDDLEREHNIRIEDIKRGFYKSEEDKEIKFNHTLESYKDKADKYERKYEELEVETEAKVTNLKKEIETVCNTSKTFGKNLALIIVANVVALYIISCFK